MAQSWLFPGCLGGFAGCEGLSSPRGVRAALCCGGDSPPRGRSAGGVRGAVPRTESRDWDLGCHAAHAERPGGAAKKSKGIPGRGLQQSAALCSLRRFSTLVNAWTCCANICALVQSWFGAASCRALSIPSGEACAAGGSRAQRAAGRVELIVIVMVEHGSKRDES